MLVMRLIHTYVMGDTRFAREQAQEQQYNSCAFSCRYYKHSRVSRSRSKSMEQHTQSGAHKCQVEIKLYHTSLEKPIYSQYLYVPQVVSLAPKFCFSLRVAGSYCLRSAAMSAYSFLSV